MAAKATVFADEVESAQEPRSFFLAAVTHQVRDEVVAFEAARLREAPGEHGVIPELAVLPVVGMHPLLLLRESIRHMRRVQEIRGTALPAVTDRAAEFFDGVRA